MTWVTSEHLIFPCVKFKALFKSNAYSLEFLSVLIPLLLNLTINVPDLSVLLGQVIVQVDLETWMLVLVVTVKVHVHSSVKEPSVRQILALNLRLNCFDFLSL